MLVLIISSGNKKRFVYLRGTKLVSNRQLKESLKQKPKPKYPPQLQIAGIPVPEHYENRGFFFIGAPGSGKTSAIKQLVASMKKRKDYRGMILDRGGEMLESFYDPKLDVIFNPFDERSCHWQHTLEPVRPQTLAAGLIPLPEDGNKFFADAARVIISAIYSKTKNNAEVYELVRAEPKVLHSMVSGTFAARYLEEERARTSVLSTLNNYCQFYESLTQSNNPGLSFFRWASSDSPRWIFIILRENDTELLKPLYSLLFELMLKGLISNINRSRKTAIVIDELGALNQLPSLTRLFNEGRKFQGCPFLGTQSDSQLLDIYGRDKARAILTGLQTKIILRCVDEGTGRLMAEQLGKQEVIMLSESFSQNRSRHGIARNSSQSEQVRERFVVMPDELKLPDFKGYLSFTDLEVPQISKIKIKRQNYPARTPQFIPTAHTFN
ncbi:MAG: type IV secretion system DNA-binding domain-containing protein [Waterburya sp.]